MLLSSEVEAWQTALNTHERVKMKSASMLEEWLPDLNTRMHDHEETLPAVIEAGKMLARIAGLGMPTDVVGNIGERFVINISMGPQAAPLEFAKDVTPVKIIEGEVTSGGNSESDQPSHRRLAHAMPKRIVRTPARRSVGSGKTTCCVFELCADRARSTVTRRHPYTRFAIVRQTLKQLKHVLKDILSWLEGLVSLKSATTGFLDGRSEVEWILIPGLTGGSERLLSMQLTGVWMSEAIEMHVDSGLFS
jgi:hypothetical protein